MIFPEAEAKPVTVEVADTPTKRTLGLMFRKSLENGKGMWFVFPDEKELVFWMKNVSFPIDIVFIDSRLFIRKIHRSVPPCLSGACATYSSGAKALYALEVPSGYCQKHGILENQKVIYRP